MTTDEYLKAVNDAETAYNTARQEAETKKAAAETSIAEYEEAKKAVKAASVALSSAKSDLAKALGLKKDPIPAPSPSPDVAPTTDVKPAPKPKPVVKKTTAEPNNNILYVLIAGLVLWLAISNGFIKIHNPFNPPAPTPTPTPDPQPKPIVNPLHAVYIFDKGKASQTTGDIRGATEEIQSALASINATYRAADFNDDEAQKFYKSEIDKIGRFPFLLIQDKITGKLVTASIVNPSSKEDIINAVKNARNGL